MASTFNAAKGEFAAGNISWASDTDIYFMLVASFTPNVDDTTITAVLEDTTEASGAGYYRALASGKTSTLDAVNDWYELDASSHTWENIDAGTVGGVIVYQGTGDSDDDGSNIPLGYVEFSDVTTNGGDLTVNWNADGVLKVT